MAPTLLCAFMIFAFQFNVNGCNWLWQGKEIVAIILAVSAIIFGLFWFMEQRQLHKSNTWSGVETLISLNIADQLQFKMTIDL